MLNINKSNSSYRGKSGTSISAGIHTDEYLAALQGSDAAHIYDKMRRSETQIRKVLNAIILPIKAGIWEIESVSDEQIDLKAAALMNQILFRDINWDNKLGEILTVIPFGHSVFEVTHMNKENKEFGLYTGLKGLGFRKQTSLLRWHYDEFGVLKSIEQYQSGDVPVQNVLLPSETLLIFYNEKEGDDIGFPILRNLYGAYKRKLLIQELKIIGIERAAIPTPKVKVPSRIKTNSQEYRDAETLIAGFTSAENQYIMYPEGWEVDLVPTTFDPSKLEASIKSENEEMAGAFLASFLELGTGGNGGAYALGSDLSDFFMSVIESFPRMVCNIINNELIPNLMRLNYGDKIDLYPKLKCSGINNKAGKELMEIITGYINTGSITNDEMLEDFIRKQHNLPKKAEGDAIDNQIIDEPKPKKEIIEEVIEEKPIENDLEEPKKEQIKKMADKIPRTPKQLIAEQQLKIRELMKENLSFISDKYIADLTRSYEQLGKSQKLRAISLVKVGGNAKFKRQLKGLLNSIAQLAVNQVKDETGLSDIKFKDNLELIKELDPDNHIKLQDKGKLPKHVQLLIDKQSELLVDRTTTEMTSNIALQYTVSEQTTNDVEIIRTDMQNRANDYVEGGAVQKGATNTASSIVNDTRYQFFFDPEVIDKVESFTFTNSDPISDICMTLNGVTFPTNNRAMIAYNPPLHHNCKSYLVANMSNSKRKRPITHPEGTPAISEKARKSITLKEV